MQREMRKERKFRHEIETWKQCLFGAMAGYSLWILVYPVVGSVCGADIKGTIKQRRPLAGCNQIKNPNRFFRPLGRSIFGHC